MGIYHDSFKFSSIQAMLWDKKTAFEAGLGKPKKSLLNAAFLNCFL